MNDETTTRVRPVEPADLDMLASVGRDPELAGEFSWWGFSGAERIRRRFEETGCLTENSGMLIVEDRGAAAGFVTWHRVEHGPGVGSQCWNIGIWLEPSARGRGLGVVAQELLVRYLFATTPVVRVEAGTDIQNVAEQRALEKAGFEREGVLRKAQFRDGAWRDVALFSRLRHE